MARKARFNFACLTHAKFATLCIALQHKVGWTQKCTLYLADA